MEVINIFSYAKTNQINTKKMNWISIPFSNWLQNFYHEENHLNNQKGKKRIPFILFFELNPFHSSCKDYVKFPLEVRKRERISLFFSVINKLGRGKVALSYPLFYQQSLQMPIYQHKFSSPLLFSQPILHCFFFFFFFFFSINQLFNSPSPKPFLSLPFSSFQWNPFHIHHIFASSPSG